MFYFARFCNIFVVSSENAFFAICGIDDFIFATFHWNSVEFLRVFSVIPEKIRIQTEKITAAGNFRETFFAAETAFESVGLTRVAFVFAASNCDAIQRRNLERVFDTLPFDKILEQFCLPHFVEHHRLHRN